MRFFSKRIVFAILITIAYVSFTPVATASDSVDLNVIKSVINSNITVTFSKSLCFQSDAYFSSKLNGRVPVRVRPVRSPSSGRTTESPKVYPVFNPFDNVWHFLITLIIAPFAIALLEFIAYPINRILSFWVNRDNESFLDHFGGNVLIFFGLFMFFGGVIYLFHSIWGEVGGYIGFAVCIIGHLGLTIGLIIYDIRNEKHTQSNKTSNNEEYKSKEDADSADLTRTSENYNPTREQTLADAYYNLGLNYYSGNGYAKDFEEAFDWFRKAAEQGHIEAQFALGFCYIKGEGVLQDNAEGVKWYQKAAEQGNVYAQYNLGMCYEYGVGVPINKAEAIKWFRKAAERGLSEAQYILGLCYFKGEDVSKDTAETVTWWRKAAEQGNEDAIKALQELNES